LRKLLLLLLLLNLLALSRRGYCSRTFWIVRRMTVRYQQFMSQK